jgi:thioredoxin-related protein
VDPERDPSDAERRARVPVRRVAIIAICIIAFCLMAALGQRAIQRSNPIGREPTLVEAMAEAVDQGRLIAVVFTAPDCVPCQAMDAEAWANAEVTATLERDYVLLRLEPWMVEYERAARAYGVRAAPSIVLTTAGGAMLVDSVGKPRRHEGQLGAPQLLALLRSPSERPAPERTPRQRLD